MSSPINHNHILSLLQDGFTTINITFDNPVDEFNAADRARNRSQQVKAYTYKARLDQNIKAGDQVVVETPKNGMTIVTVVSVDEVPKIDLSAPFPYKWIVQKVDRTLYDTMVAQEDAFRLQLVEIERQKQREAVLNDLQNRLPADSEARKAFDQALTNAKALPHAR